MASDAADAAGAGEPITNPSDIVQKLKQDSEALEHDSEDATKEAKFQASRAHRGVSLAP